MLLSSFPMDWQSCPLVFGSCKTSARLVVISQSCPLVAYPASQVFYHWHDPTLAVAYEGKLQLSQFDIINTKYRQINCSRSDANTGQTVVQYSCTRNYLASSLRIFFCSASSFCAPETHWVLSYTGQQDII